MIRPAVFKTVDLDIADGWQALSATDIVGDFVIVLPTAVSMRYKTSSDVTKIGASAGSIPLFGVNLADIQVKTASDGVSIYVFGSAGVVV